MHETSTNTKKQKELINIVRHGGQKLPTDQQKDIQTATKKNSTTMIVIVQMTDLTTVIISPTDDMTITIVKLNHIAIVIQRAKVQGVTISHEKNTTKEDTAVKLKGTRRIPRERIPR